MKRNLLIVAAVIAAAPPLLAELPKEVPVLIVGAEKWPRSIYGEIEINAGTPAVVKTEPALKVGNDTPVLRSVYNTIEVNAGTPAETKTESAWKVGTNTPVLRSEYNEISVNAQAKTYTLVSKTNPSKNNKTYSFATDSTVTSVMHTYTVKAAVIGTYTLKANETAASAPVYNRSQAQAAAADLTYNFKSAPNVSSVMHTYVAVPAEIGSYKLVSNDPDNYGHQEYKFTEQPVVGVSMHPENDLITEVESVEQAVEAMMSYHRATQTLRAEWRESCEVLISNVSGQIVLRGRLGGDVGTLSVASLPAGVYIASNRGGESRQTLKFIK